MLLQAFSPTWSSIIPRALWKWNKQSEVQKPERCSKQVSSLENRSGEEEDMAVFLLNKLWADTLKDSQLVISGGGGGEHGGGDRYNMNHLKPTVAIKPPNKFKWYAFHITSFWSLFFYAFRGHLLNSGCHLQNYLATETAHKRNA